MMSDKEQLRLEESDEEFRLVVENPVPDYPTASEDIDASFAAIVRLCRESLGDSFKPLRITMRRPKPANMAPFQEFFRAPIQYAGNEDSICFDKTLVVAPLPTANAEVARSSEKIVQDYLARFDRSSVAMQVRARLTEQLSSGHVTQGSSLHGRVAFVHQRDYLSAGFLRAIELFAGFQALDRQVTKRLSCGVTCNIRLTASVLFSQLAFQRFAGNVARKGIHDDDVLDALELGVDARVRPVDQLAGTDRE